VGRVRRCESSSLRGARLEGPAPPRAEMRASGIRGLLIYCSDYHCSHWTAISGDRWPDDVRNPIWSLGLPARRAAGVARMCGPIGRV
jgi:hypothetical protein